MVIILTWDGYHVEFWSSLFIIHISFYGGEFLLKIHDKYTRKIYSSCVPQENKTTEPERLKPILTFQPLEGRHFTVTPTSTDLDLWSKDHDPDDLNRADPPHPFRGNKGAFIQSMGTIAHLPRWHMEVWLPWYGGSSLSFDPVVLWTVYA